MFQSLFFAFMSMADIKLIYSQQFTLNANFKNKKSPNSPNISLLTSQNTLKGTNIT